LPRLAGVDLPRPAGDGHAAAGDGAGGVLGGGHAHADEQHGGDRTHGTDYLAHRLSSRVKVCSTLARGPWRNQRPAAPSVPMPTRTRPGAAVALAALAMALAAPLHALRAQAPNATPAPPLHSFVVRADSGRTPLRPNATGAVRSVVDSATPTLAKLEIHVTYLAPGQSPHAPHRHAHEELLVVTKGTLEVTQAGVTRRAPAGSVIFEASNELHGARNVGADTAQYYVIRVDPHDLPAEPTPATPATPARRPR